MVEDNLLNTLHKHKIKISEEKIHERLFDRYRWPIKYPWGQPTVEVITEEGSKHQDFFYKDGFIDTNKCLSLYEEGYTLILSNVGTLFSDFVFVQGKLNQKYKKWINCNLYFGNGKKSISFPKHTHPYAVIVKNIFGESKWIINKQEVIIKDQECIWFDKETDHEVVQINKPKASLTCNIVV